MFSLKQAARLAYDKLVSNLEPNGYYPVRACPGLWKCTSRPTVFSLCVDDFGVKHHSKEDLNHLLEILRKHYKCTIDKEGKNYLGLTLSWNYVDKYVDASMPGYIRAASATKTTSIFATPMATTKVWPTYPLCWPSRFTITKKNRYYILTISQRDLNI